MKPASLIAGVGTAGVLGGALIVAALHVVPPSGNLDPVRRTISEYALLANGWVFDLAVLVLAAGSALILGILVARRVVPPLSLGFLGLALWSLGLAGVVLFPKHNWSSPTQLAIGSSPTGDIHRAASLIAFLSLPVAAIAIGRAWRRGERWRGHANAVLTAGVVALLCIAPLGYAILTGPLTGVRWWRAIPLGAVERAIALSEVVVVLAFGVWATRAGVAQDPAASDQQELAAVR